MDTPFINRVAKFAQAPRRIVEISGVAYQNALTWAEDIRPPAWYENSIAESLRASGWGVYMFKLTPQLSFIQQTYNFVAQIDTMQNDNPERIRQGVFNVVSNFIPNVEASVTQDYVLQPNDGGYQAIPTVNTSQLPRASEPLSLWEQVFGKETSAIDAGGKVFGLSVGTLVVGGIIYIVVTSGGRKRR